MNQSRTLLLTLAGVVLLISSLHIAGHVAQASDQWWTPTQLSPSLPDVADRVEVYVRGVRLDEHVKAGRLQLADGTGPATIAASEIRFRFNNWDRVRAQAIPWLLASGAGVGASCAVLLYVLAGWRRARRLPPAP